MQILTTAGALLAAASAILSLRQGPSRLLTLNLNPDQLIASNTYLGPTTKNSSLVRIEVLIRDSEDPSGPQIVSANFNKTNIPLQPRDIYGNRGSGSFQLAPGTYRLRWVTNQNKIAWPRNAEHEEQVTISPRDLWIQIQINGDKATIS